MTSLSSETLATLAQFRADAASVWDNAVDGAGFVDKNSLLWEAERSRVERDAERRQCDCRYARDCALAAWDTALLRAQGGKLELALGDMASAHWLAKCWGDADYERQAVAILEAVR